MPIQESPGVVVHDPQRANHLLMLEFGDRKDFDDPRLEYRRLFSGLLGTFMLVLVAAGGGILHAKGQISLAAAVVAPGLMARDIDAGKVTPPGLESTSSDADATP
jgi:hypothetical protein